MGTVGALAPYRGAVESCEGLGQSLEGSLGGGVRRGLLRSLLDRGSHQQTLQNIEQIVEARQVPQVSEDGHKHGGQDGARASEEDAGEAGPPQPQEALRARSKHPDAAGWPWWSQTPLPPPHTPQFVHLGNGGSSDPCWGEDESGVGGFP